MLEERIVRFCAPTLAGIKTGNLINSCGIDKDTFYREYHTYKTLLAPLGIGLHVFTREKGNPLLYVYRKRALKADLEKADYRAFLNQYGYIDTTIESALARLGERINESESFPHEIGLFLSYPLEDVKGFIQYGSKCCKCTGYWCVYSDETKAKHHFARYDRCRVCYERLYRQGRGLGKLALATR